MAELSVLIVNYNSWRECATAIATLREHGPKQRDGSPMSFECIVVDNLSPQRDPAQIAAVEHELALLCEQQRDPLAGRLVMHFENGGYSKGMNVGFRHSRGRWILVSNPDVLFLPGLIERLQRHLENDPKAGCVVPKGFWDPERSGRLPPNTLPTLSDILLTTWGEFSRRVSHWHARRLARRWLAVWTAEQPIALPMMSGCMFLIERSFFESVGLFDERFPLYYEDTDLSVKIRRAGRNVVQVPDAFLVHFVNRSGMTDQESMWKRHHTSRRLYYEKWYGRLGTWALRASQWLLGAKSLQRWRRFEFETPLVDLGESARPPVLELGRQCERFLVLLSLDARFYLAAGLLGSGARWTPSPAAFDLFVAATYYFAAYDLTGGRFQRIGTWRYACLSHLGVPVPSTAATKAEVVADGSSSPQRGVLEQGETDASRRCGDEAEPPGQETPRQSAGHGGNVTTPVLSVVVLSWNTKDLTLACLRALFAEKPRHAREVIAVDNGSEDGSADAIAAAFPHVRLVRNADNRLYAAGNNQGALLAAGEYLCTLNSDTEVRPGALDLLVDFLQQHRGHGAVAPRLCDPDGRVQHACMRFPTLLTALCFDSWWGTFWPGSRVQDRYLMRDFDHQHSRDVDQPPGACFLMRTSEWRELGGLDEKLALFYNDVDLCKRLRSRGRAIHYLAEAEVMHHRGASTRNFAKMLVVWHKNRFAYYRKHHGALGALWIRVCVRLRIWEEWLKIGRRNPHDATRRRDERDHLRKAAAELWS